MTRRDLVKAISPNRNGVDKLAWNPHELTRSEAEGVVNAVFDTITEALWEGKKVELPFGKFEVKRRPARKRRRAWVRNRVIVSYRKRKYFEFTPGDGLPGGENSAG